MNFNGLVENITNPALLFFLLGIIATRVKSDLSIPETSSKFIAAYLLLSIGFKGGQELSHTGINMEVGLSLLLGLFLSAGIPIMAYFILKNKLSVQNAGAVAAAYGSVSAVTFVTTVAFLQSKDIEFGGHMVAIMAVMEAPAIVVGLLLAKIYSKKEDNEDELVEQNTLGTIKHALTNGSVLLIIGSLIIGYIASEKQAEGIAPFTRDIFKGFLAVFLLDMGITCGKQIQVLAKKGIFPFVFAMVVPFVNGFLAIFLASLITKDPGNLMLFAILGAGASYIAVPAAMKNALPKSQPTLYLSMALGITFPVNVMIGIPLYYEMIPYLV